MSFASQTSDAVVQEAVEGKSDTREMIVDPLSGLALVGTYLVDEFWVPLFTGCAI